MKKHTRTFLGLPAALIALLAVVACDDDSAGPAGDDALTAEEARALVDGLAAVAGLVSTDATALVADRPEVNCPLGGTVRQSGTVTPESTGSSTIIRTELVMTPQNCQFAARGTTFTANGAPDVRQVGEVTIIGLSERIEMDFDITGAVDWETGSPARRGRCSLDLDLTGEIDQRPGSQPTDTVAVLRGSLSGTACDEAVNLSLDDIGGS